MQLLDRFEQRRRLDRLDQIAVHPRLQAAFAITHHRMRGQRDDGNISPRSLFPVSNCRGGFDPVHSGHLHVHEDEIEALTFERLQRGGPVVHGGDCVTLFLEHVLGESAVYRIVLDQQDMQRRLDSLRAPRRLRCPPSSAASRYAGHGADGIQKFRLLDRLGEAGQHLAVEAVSFFLASQRRTEHDHTLDPEARVLPYLRGEFIAVHVRQSVIQKHDSERRLCPLRLCQDFRHRFAALGFVRLDVPSFQRVHEDAAADRMVFHHQSPQLLEIDRPLFALRHGLKAEAYREVKNASLARLAFDPDLSVHHFHQTLRDRQPQSRAPVDARRRGIALQKRREDSDLFFLVDADSGVAHGEITVHLATVARLGLNAHHHFAALGELDCIAHQVEYDLAQPHRVAEQRIGGVGPDFIGELEALSVGPERQRFHGVAQGLAQGERDGLDLQPPRLDLREIQNIVDDRQEGGARGLYEIEVLALLRRQSRLQSELGPPDDGIHRSPDFVTHVSQKLRLRQVRGLGRPLRLVQLLLALLAHLDFLPQQVVRGDETRSALPYLGFKALVDLRQFPFRDFALVDLRLELRALAVQIDEHRHLRLQDVDIYRLQNVVHRPDFVPSEDRLSVFENSSEENDGGVTGTLELADQRGGFETVHFGHANVEQNEREVGFENLSQCLLPRPGR